MITFVLPNLKRETSSIALLVSFRGKKYKRSTGESVSVGLWNNNKKRVKVTGSNTSGNDINEILDKWESTALQTLAHFKNNLNPPTTEAFLKVLNSIYFTDPEDETTPEAVDFFEIFDKFLSTHKLSEIRKNGYYVLIRALKRYELYRKIKLDINTITSDDIRDFETFLKTEHTLFTQDKDGRFICKPKYLYIYKAVPESATPKERGRNTIATELNKFKAFTRWAVNVGEYTTNNPFVKFQIQQELYGTPYYISIDERNQIYNFDLSHKKSLEIQRDIFVFQCLIGCRVSDLYKLTKDNIIDNAIEYIPSKTKEGSPITVRVPLNKHGVELINKYDNPDGEATSLFPFISDQKYNIAIKKIFTEVGITRSVTVLSSLTGETIQRPINELASSHIARRTFVGNLYKKVKDPNLIGSLSGHKEGSKAFSRYREIDEDIKRELIDMIE